jgi:hypothetical protein
VAVILVELSDEKYVFASFKILTYYYDFLSAFPNQRVLNRDPSVWLDGAIPANTCIPHPFPGSTPTQL